MAYDIKYIMQFTSDRGNEIRIEVLKRDYQGEIIYKSLGGAPSLSIEQGDGAIKGSSLAFAMQADVEGELQELYTTDNKKFKVFLYRNNVLYWQGYLVPELYSENYVDPPYDVEVIASDQLGILKNVTYNEEDVLTSLIEIIQKILAQTLLDIQCSIHLQLSTKQGLLLETSYISAAAFNGQSCYDALNSILQSCNCCIMQIANEWIILSVTDATVLYSKNGEVIEKAHCTIGQMGNADVCPEGSVTMVNAPAIKGVTVGYNHTLRNSMLKNANCVNRSEWSYTPGGVEERFPGEIDMGDVVCKCYFWLLKQKNLKEDSSLQLWQDIALEHDTDNAYNLSFRYMFMSEADLLLLSVVYATDSNKTLYLTSNGWKTGLDKTNVNSYIHVTGTNGNSTSVYSMSDASKYQEASISFMLPNEPGALRIGFINCTSDYSDPFFTRQILVTDVYLTVDGVTGKTATTLVEPSATSPQEEMAIVYGEPINSVNAQALDMTYLRYKDGTAVGTVYLSGQEYSSYYPAIVQDFSRYYGVKKMQLQGALMGADVLHPLYVDIFTEKVLRLVSGQYDLLHDTVSVSIEEVPVTFVEYDLVVFAQENNPNKNTTTNSGTTVVGGGGESLLGIQSDGDVFVKNNRAITGVEAKFAALALPITKPSSTTEEKTYLYSSSPATYPAIDIAKVIIAISNNATDITVVSNRVQKFEDVIGIDSNGDVYIKGMRNFYTERGTIGMAGLGSGGSGGGGGTAGLGSVTVRVNGKDYITDASGIVTIPDYPTSLPASDVYSWAKAATKPSYTASEVGALSTSGGTITISSYQGITIKRASANATPLLWFSNNNGNLGAIGFNANKEVVIDNTSTEYTLIHSGNIGSYNAGSATKLQTARTIWGQNFDGAGNITKTLHITEPVPNTEYAEGIRINTMNGDFSSIWFNTINISGYDKGMWGITAMASGNFRIRGGANGLSDLVNITKDGNVLMGTTNDGGHKLRVQGSSYVTGEGIFGGVISANSGILSRNELSFRNNAVIQSYSLPLQINPQGNNVLIGTNADNGAMLQVNGNISAVTFRTNGDVGMWKGSTFTGSLTADDLAYYANKHIFYGSNVGISTPNPQYKLDVNGTTRTTELKIGSATLSWDETNKALKISSNVYSDGTIAMGELGEGGSGTGGATGIVTIRVNGADYTSSNGIVTLPNYPTVPTSLPASDVYSWAKAATKPSYTASEVGALSTKGGTLSGGLTISSGNLLVEKGDTITNKLYPIADNAYILGQNSRRWSDVRTVLINGGTPIHSGNYSDYALPKSGGTINGGLSINRGGYPYISYSNSNTFYGHLGFSGVGIPSMYDGTAWKDLIHSGNYSSYALPLSGGTISSSELAPLNIKRNSTGAAAIAYSGQSVTYGTLGFNDTTGPKWFDASYAEYTLIHSGNIGSYNAGSATKLQTARTIWGQNFDGAGNITKTLHITEPVPNTEYAEGIRINTMNGDFSSIWFNTINISGYDKGMWGITAMASGNFRIRGGANGLSDLVNITKDGNVLMGTTNDGGHKLRVQGSSYVTGEGIFGGVISANSGILSRNELSFRNNAIIQSYSLPLQINPQGNNVLIGTIEDKGNCLYVYKGGADGDVARFGSSATWCALVVEVDGAKGWSVGCNNKEEFYFYSHRNAQVLSISNTGDVVAQGTIAMARLASSSDRKLKDNIADVSAEQSMGIIRKLRPTTWDWKKDGKKSYGLIAQEVAPIVPEMVVDMGHLHLEYNQLHAFEIGAIKHIDSEVEILKRRVNELENEIRQYRRA